MSSSEDPLFDAGGRNYSASSPAMTQMNSADQCDAHQLSPPSQAPVRVSPVSWSPSPAQIRCPRAHSPPSGYVGPSTRTRPSRPLSPQPWSSSQPSPPPIRCRSSALTPPQPSFFTQRAVSPTLSSCSPESCSENNSESLSVSVDQPPKPPRKKEKVNQEKIAIQIQSKIQGIEDDKAEMEKLKRQMEKIEATMMEKEVELSQLEWKNECCRTTSEFYIGEYEEHVGSKGWAGTDYESLKKVLDGLKSSFTNAPQSTSAETKEEVQERDMTIQMTFKNLTSLSARAFEIASLAPKYDVCEQLKGNGWRSFLSVLESCLLSLQSQLKKNDKKWWRTINRDTTCFKFIQTWDTISSLAVNVLLKNSPVGSLFPAEGFEGVLNEFLSLPLEVFYGKFFGVQYDKGLRRVLGLLLVAMASFGDGVKSSGEGVRGRFRALMTSTKYLAFNKKAALRTVQLFGSGDVNFLKAFWELQETVSFVEIDTAIRTPSPSLNLVFRITVLPISVPAQQTDFVTVDTHLIFEEHNAAHHSREHYFQQDARKKREKALSTEFGADHVKVEFDKDLKRGLFSHVQVRIISYYRHKGQLSANGYEKLSKFSSLSMNTSCPGIVEFPSSKAQGDKSPSPRVESKEEANRVEKMASGLLIHIHGGGFVAQTSKAHLNYLRDYAKAINAPIFSIDYSLSPENPFPQPLYEVFFAYCWALAHANLLGTKAERVVLTGDSAGANLVIAVTMLAIQEGVRVPDAIVPIYPALLAKRIPSPARILSVMDPLLGTGVLLQCLHCYSAGLEVSDQFLSPVLCSDELLQQFPPVQIVVGSLDPLLDDSILFAKHLRRNNKEIILHILDKLPHGFLGFNRVCGEATQGTKVVIEHLQYAFQLTSQPPFRSISDLEKTPDLLQARSATVNTNSEFPEKVGVVVIEVFDSQKEEAFVGFVQLKGKKLGLSQKIIEDCFFEVYQKQNKNSEKDITYTACKHLKKQKFLSHNCLAGPLSTSDSMGESEFVDTSTPTWKMTLVDTEGLFYLSQDDTLMVGTTSNPLSFKLKPQESLSQDIS